jgi:hypothetical protein
MDFLNNSVYGVPLVILLAIWWMTTQLKGNNSNFQNDSNKSQNQPTTIEMIKCRSCSKLILVTDKQCKYCSVWQRKLP